MQCLTRNILIESACIIDCNILNNQIVLVEAVFISMCIMKTLKFLNFEMITIKKVN